MKLKFEPVMVGQILSALATLAVAFGFEVTDEQVATIVAAVMIVVGFIQRSKVTPVAKLNRNKNAIASPSGLAENELLGDCGCS